MAKPKGLISVKEASLMAFNDMPDEWYGSQISDRSNMYTQRLRAFPDTTMRKLRELRSEGVIDFECIHKGDSKYRKIDVLYKDYIIKLNPFNVCNHKPSTYIYYHKDDTDGTEHHGETIQECEVEIDEINK